ncbi:MAG: S8 family serine peptidase [Bacteroidales bacterium]|nr:S8 family serine peptidase [Bacteroidales bacterium]
MKKIYLLGVFLILAVITFAQKEILLGSGKIKPKENVKEFIYGKQNLPESTAYKGEYYVVVQFNSIPTKKEKEALKAKGIELKSYIQDRMYYATIKKDAKSSVANTLKSTSIRSILAVDPLWKIEKSVYAGNIPEHAKGSEDMAKIEVLYFDNSDLNDIKSYLAAKGLKNIKYATEFNSISLEIPLNQVNELAKQPWVKWIEFTAAPAELENVRGRSMSRSNILGQTALGGRGLTGKGVNVGIWDGSIEAHPDLGNRLITKEFETASEHGQHTSGTLTGAGLLDPKAKGMAPEATLYAWNFNGTQNGLSTQQEMLISARDHNVVITSNSYGVGMNATTCATPSSYNAADLQLDQLQNMYPSLLHVFSAGNDQEDCLESTGSRYGTSTKRAKNSIFVGALDQLTGMTYFSSWGPMNDGRILPHISAFGDYVYSTVYGNKYADDIWSGTSMACPNVSGTSTLLYQRYKQIYGTNPISSLIKGALLNSAEDKGNPGPDYQFGYGAMDGLRAVEIIEKNRFFINTIENGEEATHTITVPAGAKELRVMLVWTDVQGVSASKALINDLNMYVYGGGGTYTPWVLNPQNPSANATEGIDNLNNQEQITIANPTAGTYTVKIMGFEVPSGPQQYAVVYDYYMPTLTLTYPNGGEKFKQGDSPIVRWNSIGYTGTYTLQLSTDNGATFQTIATNIPNNQKDYIVTLPNTVTSQGLIRVIQDGTMDISDATFSIMDVPQNVQLVPALCSTTGWQLKWDAVTGATKYKVLKANVNAGSYTEIGETALTAFDLPALESERNIYSVAAVSADGTVGERAYAVMANPSLGVDLKAIGLPFEEKLIQFPSNYVQVSAGNGVKTSYEQTLFEYSGAHIIKMLGNETTTTTWNATGDLFANNPDDVASAKICEIDATNITGKLWFRIAALMANTGADNARFRVLANGVPLTNTYGDAEISKVESGENIMYYDLSNNAGSKFSIECQAVLRNAKDSLQFGHFLLWQPKNDVSISKLTVPAASATLSNSESITIDVRNNSGETIGNIPVSYTINGGVIVEEVIAGPIAPFAKTTYTFSNKADLSEVDVLFEITASVQYPGDEVTSNNSKTAQTTRIGDYYIMPKTTTGNTLKATSTIKQFTDDGGKAANYSNGVKGAVVIEPTTTGKKVKIKFVEFNLENNYDKLIIRDGGMSYSPIVATLTGSSIPNDIYALSSNGSFRVEFTSDSEGTEAGWLAEVTEVDASAVVTDNTFTVSSNNMNGNYSIPSSVKISVKNNSTEEVTNVPVRYKIDNGVWVEEQIASIAAGQTKYHTFSQQITIPQLGTEFTITVEVPTADGLITDNTYETKIKSDIYCFPYSNYLSTSPFYITEVEKAGIVKATGAPTNAYAQYYRDIVFPLYKDLSNETLNITVNSHQYSGKIGVFVDWDNNGVYNDAGEGPFSVNTTDGVTSYNIPITVPTSAAAGQYFMRVRASTNSSTVDPCRSEYSNNGEVEDYTVEVIENYPITKDVAITATNLVSGSNLTSTEIVKATIINNASVAINNFDVAFKVNSGTEIRETVTATINPFSSYEYTFTGKANMLAAGSYTIEIYTLLADDQAPENDKLTTTIFNESPAVDGFFALNFDGTNDFVNAGTLGNTNLQSFTYEAWINPASYGGYGGPIGFGRLFEGKAATIFLHGETNTNYPEHCLVVSSIGGGTYYTEANSINLNEWQHIAIAFDNGSKALKVYRNGIEVPVVTKTAATTIADNSANSLFIGNNASFARAFKGMIDEARVWSVVRTQANIQDGMYTHQAGETGLVAEFRFDEGHFNSKTYSGTIQASILNADISDSESSIWAVPTVGFASYAFASQVIDWEEVADNHYRTEVASGTNLSTLIADFTPNYPNATVKVGTTAQVSGSTQNNFTNSETTPVEYDFTASIFGKTLTNTVKISVKEELSNQAAMETFSIASISLNASPANPNTVFDVDGATNVTALTPTFTLSAGAKAYINDVEITSGSKSLNFSNPVVFKVIAANGRTANYYNVSIRKTQTITWTPASVTKTYGDATFTLEAASSAGANIVYTSSNPDIISVGFNKATITGVGTTTITAYQYGGNNLVAATPVEKVFTVNKKQLTVTADNKAIDYTDAIPELTMSFGGFAEGEDESEIDVLPTISTTAVQGSAAGNYPITLTGGSDNNYALTLVNGTLTINDVSVYDVTFNVTFNSNPVNGASVTVNGTTAQTDASGNAVVQLKSGTYSYEVTNAGCEPYSGNVTVGSSNTTVDVVLVATLPVYTITYTTDGNGSITGSATQSVKQGQDGTEVTALPKLGYIFEQWSDGNTNATRKETNVQNDITITAQFTLKAYTLTYNAGTNGVLTGNANQTVQHGNSGTEVSVTPNTGYTFVQWSDGNKDNPRTDANVMADVNVTAEYSKIYTLPYTQTFDGTTLPEDWMNVDKNASGGVWAFKAATKDSKSLTGSTANHAILDSDLYGSGKTQNSDLVSPMFDLSSYSTVNLKFKHYYRHSYGCSATLSYSINGVDWVQIGDKWTANTANPTTFEQEIAAVAGQNNVRFKWNFTGTWGYYWLVDDIEITGAAAASEYTVTYRAGANGTLSGATGGVITQTVAHGANGPEVTAVPDAGYAFYQWSDGVTDNPRTDIVVSPIDVTAEFGSDCAPITSVPYIEDFNAKASAPDCWSTPENASGLKWSVGEGSYTISSGYSAHFDGMSVGFGKTETAELVSPTFDLSAQTEVYLSFRHLHYPFSSSTAKILYSMDNGNSWTELGAWTDEAWMEHFCKKLPATSATMKFKWVVTCTGMNIGWYIDNVELRNEATVMLSYSAQEVKDANDDWISLGTIEGNSEQLIVLGTSGTAVTAVPISGYHFVKWSDDNTANPRIDTDVTVNVSVIALFEEGAAPTTYTLTYTAGANGTITGEATQTVAEGGSGTEVEAVPATGYHFVKWSDDVTTAKRTDANVTANITVTAEFAINTYTLTYTAGANGSITGTTSQTVDHGASGAEVEAIPNSGFKFTKWSDGLTTAKRTDANVTADINVTAEFEVNTEVESNTLSSITIYPNPFTNNVNIKNTQNVTEVTISDIIGHTLIRQKNNGNAIIAIETNSLKPGIYFATIVSDNGKKIVRKIVKE